MSLYVKKRTILIKAKKLPSYVLSLISISAKIVFSLNVVKVMKGYARTVDKNYCHKTCLILFKYSKQAINVLNYKT